MDERGAEPAGSCRKGNVRPACRRSAGGGASIFAYEDGRKSGCISANEHVELDARRPAVNPRKSNR